MLPLEPLGAVSLSIVHGLRQLLIAQSFVKDRADVGRRRQLVIDIARKVFRSSSVGEVSAGIRIFFTQVVADDFDIHVFEVRVMIG